MKLSLFLLFASIGLDRANADKKFRLPTKEEIGTYEAEDDGGAVRFAVPYPVTMTPNGLDWNSCETKGGDRKCCTHISAKGAKSLNFGFTEYNPGEKTKITIAWTRERPMPEVVIIDTISEASSTGQYWTQIFPVDEVEICSTSPINEDVGIVLGSVNVGYKEIGGGNSGGCNIDVVCPERAGWELEIASAGGISYGGGLFCSGSMVNNMEQDGTPYFLTAYHCGVRADNAASLVVYWNFETSECDGTPDGVLSDFTSGAVLRAENSQSDVTLVELISVPDPAYGVNYAGWDNTPDEYTLPGVCIHHPAGDEKRISFEEDPMSTTNYGNNNASPSGTHVRVEDWDLGTTEPGSSGSPLYNGNHRIIGQLHGGSAACGNDLPDWYGRFSLSWTGADLAEWLDPNNVLGGQFGGVDSYDPFAFPTVSPAPTPVSSTSPSGKPTISDVPSSAPTECEGDFFNVDVLTDEFPSETSWILTNTCGDGFTVFDRPLGYFTAADTLYADTFCSSAVSGSQYQFTISDSFGDGICCAYGSGEYTVVRNGVEAATGGNFDSQDSTTFGTCGPTPAPSPAPPTASPTECTGDSINIDIFTDGYPSETSYILQETCDGSTVFQRTQGYFTAEGSLYTDTICTSNSFEFLFTISDSFGDGICCDYGQGEYTVTLNDSEVATGGEFSSSDTATFGSCGQTTSPVSTPTSDPTTRPSLTPTLSPTISPSTTISSTSPSSTLTLPPTISPCEDSTLGVPFSGSTFFCEDFTSNVCNRDRAKSHCPVTCDACAEYACEDSMLDWVFDGNNGSCAQLAGAPPGFIDRACQIEEIVQTCRSTCGSCD